MRALIVSLLRQTSGFFEEALNFISVQLIFCHSCSQRETCKTRELRKNKEISWSYDKQLFTYCRKREVSPLQ